MKDQKMPFTLTSLSGYALGNALCLVEFGGGIAPGEAALICAEGEDSPPGWTNGPVFVHGSSHA
jgi:hypothetical protein